MFSKAIFAKFIPCFLLVTFTSLLISSLIVINKNNKKLNSGYGAKSKLIKDSKSKSFIQKLYFFKKSDKDNQVLVIILGFLLLMSSLTFIVHLRLKLLQLK